MVRVCKICRLPLSILIEVNRKIRNKESYGSISKWLDERGYKISKSSVFRHSKHLKNIKSCDSSNYKQTYGKMVVTTNPVGHGEDIYDKLEAYSIVYGKEKAKKILGL